MWAKLLKYGGTVFAGIALGITVTEVAERYRTTSETDAYLDDPEFDPEEENIEEEYEEEEQNPATTTTLAPEKACAVFFVRKDLKMRKGKIAAQCGHATLGIFKKVATYYPKIAAYWYDNRFNKKFFYVSNEEEMDQFKQFAIQNSVLYEKIHDAGRTQIAAGSATVLAIGPIDEDLVESFTSSLQKL